MYPHSHEHISFSVLSLARCCVLSQNYVVVIYEVTTSPGGDDDGGAVISAALGSKVREPTLSAHTCGLANFLS